MGESVVQREIHHSPMLKKRAAKHQRFCCYCWIGRIGVNWWAGTLLLHPWGGKGIMITTYKDLQQKWSRGSILWGEEHAGSEINTYGSWKGWCRQLCEYCVPLCIVCKGGWRWWRVVTVWHEHGRKPFGWGCWPSTHECHFCKVRIGMASVWYNKMHIKIRPQIQSILWGVISLSDLYLVFLTEKIPSLP